MGLAAVVLLLLTLSLSTAAFERLAYRRPVVPVPQVDAVDAHFAGVPREERDQ